MGHELKERKQLKLWPEETFKNGQENTIDMGKQSNIVPILFRNTIPEIPSTIYGTFAIYKYPAKFIPQVIAYVLKESAKLGMKVFDPFAGYGTVGVVLRCMDMITNYGI